jgi:hypothetical protein
MQPKRQRATRELMDYETPAPEPVIEKNLSMIGSRRGNEICVVIEDEVDRGSRGGRLVGAKRGPANVVSGKGQGKRQRHSERDELVIRNYINGIPSMMLQQQP